MKKRIIFRDRATGRFASRSTWNRSKSHGGARYVRQRVEVRPAPKVPARAAARAREEEEREAHAERGRARREEEFVAEEEEEFEPFELEGSADYEEPE